MSLSRRPATLVSPRPSASPSPRRQAPVHVLVVVEENQGYGPTLGTCSADPYFCSLASTYASLTNWSGVAHGSFVDYLALDSGSTQGQTFDCGTCGPFAGADLGGQLSAKRIPWTAYIESMPWACYRGVGTGAYKKTHNPFVYFNDVLNNNCASHDVPYPGVTSMVRALNSSSAPAYVFITPNLLHDMHTGTVQQGDAWLKANLAPVLTSSWFTNFKSTVIVTMDEGGASGSNNQIATVIISNNAKGMGAIDLAGDHYGTLRTIEEAFGLSLLGGATSGTDLSSLFG